MRVVKKELRKMGIIFPNLRAVLRNPFTAKHRLPRPSGSQIRIFIFLIFKRANLQGVGEGQISPFKKAPSSCWIQANLARIFVIKIIPQQQVHKQLSMVCYCVYKDFETFLPSTLVLAPAD